MNDVFKIRDTKLLENVFMITDVEGDGALDIRELCAIMLFHTRGTIDLKLALFFEIMKNRTIVELYDGGYVLKTNLIKVIDDALKFLKQAFYNAKQHADAMNTNLDGQISYQEFHTYCEYQPYAIDFLCRLTIGNGGIMQYPQPLNQ